MITWLYKITFLIGRNGIDLLSVPATTSSTKSFLRRYPIPTIACLEVFHLYFILGAKVQSCVQVVGPVNDDYICVWNTTEVVPWFCEVLEARLEYFGFLNRHIFDIWSMWVILFVILEQATPELGQFDLVRTSNNLIK